MSNPRNASTDRKRASETTFVARVVVARGITGASTPEKISVTASQGKPTSEESAHGFFKLTTDGGQTNAEKLIH